MGGLWLPARELLIQTHVTPEGPAHDIQQQWRYFEVSEIAPTDAPTQVVDLTQMLTDAVAERMTGVNDRMSPYL